MLDIGAAAVPAWYGVKGRDWSRRAVGNRVPQLHGADIACQSRYYSLRLVL